MCNYHISIHFQDYYGATIHCQHYVVGVNIYNIYIYDQDLVQGNACTLWARVSISCDSFYIPSVTWDFIFLGDSGILFSGTLRSVDEIHVIHSESTNVQVETGQNKGWFPGYSGRSITMITLSDNPPCQIPHHPASQQSGSAPAGQHSKQHSNVVIMLGQRCRRWANIKTTLGLCLVTIWERGVCTGPGSNITDSDTGQYVADDGSEL